MREIYEGDAFTLLPELNFGEGRKAFFTSPPDMDELKTVEQVEQYSEWLRSAVKAMVERLNDQDFLVVFITDRKFKGGQISKPALIMSEIPADWLVWHKIQLRRAAGKSNNFRPTYSHLLCFSPKGTGGVAFADVLEVGDEKHKNSIPEPTVQAVTSFFEKQGVKTVVDPFCGEGHNLAWAERAGMRAVGIDIDPVMVAKANEVILA